MAVFPGSVSFLAVPRKNPLCLPRNCRLIGRDYGFEIN